MHYLLFMTNTTETPADRLESETCTRCGGTGKFSRCQQYGDTCFRCRGKRITLTDRGAAAAKYLTALRSKPASEIAIGDVVWDDCYFAPGWMTVTAVGPYMEPVALTGGETRARGMQIDGVDKKTGKERGLCRGIGGDTMIRVAQSAEQRAATLAAAVAYQATLTKGGKVRKVRAAKGAQAVAA